jgi:hypothetical protein
MPSMEGYYCFNNCDREIERPREIAISRTLKIVI